jgi:hypothetical protein
VRENAFDSSNYTPKEAANHEGILENLFFFSINALLRHEILGELKPNDRDFGVEVGVTFTFFREKV